MPVVHANLKLSPARQRLLEAAGRVFAQKGLEGATTREIARQAKVNEVTLFRHFQSKEKLLSAVLKRTFDPPDEAALVPAAATRPAAVDSRRRARRPGLRADLEGFARRYEVVLRRNILLIRTVLGGIHRHRKQEKQVLTGIFAPLKAELLTALKTARDQGQMRREIEPIIAADLFSSMIFMGVLRCSLPYELDYTPEQYLSATVDTFARGIEP